MNINIFEYMSENYFEIILKKIFLSNIHMCLNYFPQAIIKLCLNMYVYILNYLSEKYFQSILEQFMTKLHFKTSINTGVYKKI